MSVKDISLLGIPVYYQVILLFHAYKRSVCSHIKSVETLVNLNYGLPSVQQ